MRRSALITMLVAVILALSAPYAAAARDYNYGPPPDWARYKALAEPAIRAKLPDPAKWTIEWPNGYARDVWANWGRYPGYLTCGVLRASEPVPGFNPVTQFVVVIDHDEVKRVDLSSKASNSLVNVMCDMRVSRGMLPPARLMDAPRNAQVASLGLTVRVMPEGAYVVAVAPASPAARAGLSAGAVITRANGVALAGMGQAMAAVLGVDAPALTLDTAAGGHVEVRRTP
jgi:hypothetical protein